MQCMQEAEGDAGEQQALDIMNKLQQAGKLRAFGNVRQVCGQSQVDPL